MKRFITGVAGLLVAACMLFGTPALASAVDPYEGVDCSKAKDSALCTGKSNSTNNPLTGANGLLRKLTRVIAVIAGIAAVIIIMVGAFMYVTAGGDSNKAAEGRKAIIYAAVGLVVIVVAQSLILYVLSLIN